MRLVALSDLSEIVMMDRHEQTFYTLQRLTSLSVALFYDLAQNDLLNDKAVAK